MSSNIFKNPDVQKFLFQFDSFLKKHFKSFQPLPFKGHKKLKEAIEYSVFSGGKHFRPLLIFSTAQLLSIKNQIILPWAGAIEMIHAASLIHDDLPCMDNSLQRRGKASTHRRFGEDMALLAGDCLWVEAFRLIHLYGTTETLKHWLPILCEGAGFYGLMGGQALDLKVPKNPDKLYYKKMHSMKTGALISAGMQGVLALESKVTENIHKLKEVAHLIGRAFQTSDDLQDNKEESSANFVNTLGRKKAENQLHQLSNKALQLINSEQKISSSFLTELIIFNRDRSIINISTTKKDMEK